MKEKLELVHGSGNVFRDFGRADADVMQLKATLAAEIIAALDARKLSVRRAEAVTGIAAADFSRIRNVKLDRFTIDRLMGILGRLDRKVTVTVSVKPRRRAAGQAPAAA